MRRVIAVLAILFAPLVAHAQSLSSLEPPPLDQYLRWGPLRVRPAFALKGLGYDDNIFYRAEGTGLPPEGDWFATLSPRLAGIILLGNKPFVTFDGTLDYTLYANNSEINYLNSALTSRLTVPFRRVGAYVDAGWVHLEDRPLDLQDARPVRKEARFGAGVIVKLGWRSEVEIGRIDSRFRNTDENFLQCHGPGGTEPCYTIGDLLDRVETGTQVRAWYGAFGRARITMEARRKDIDFRTEDTGVVRDGTERRIVPGLDFGQGGRLRGIVSGGWSRLDIEATPGVDYDGLVGEARLVYLAGNGLSFHGSAIRDVAFSIYEGNNFYVRRLRELRAIKYFNRIFGVDVGYGNGRLNFPAGTRNDRLTSYDGGVRFRIAENALGRRVEYVVRWVRTETDSTANSLDQSRSTLSVSAVLGY